MQFGTWVSHRGRKHFGCTPTLKQQEINQLKINSGDFNLKLPLSFCAYAPVCLCCLEVHSVLSPPFSQLVAHRAHVFSCTLRYYYCAPCTIIIAQGERVWMSKEAVCESSWWMPEALLGVHWGSSTRSSALGWRGRVAKAKCLSWQFYTLLYKKH